MYLRYRAKYFNEKNQKIEFGFFWAAEYLKNNVDLDIEDSTRLEELIHWFDHNLPIPDYYQDEKNRQAAKSATSWYKDTAQKFIKPMNGLAWILEKYHIDVERINSKKIPGKKIYEDDYQITVLPYRDMKKKIE